MIIHQFGKIEEVNGVLVFSNFSINGENSEMNVRQSILFAVMQRLIAEFEKECKTAVYRPTNDQETAL